MKNQLLISEPETYKNLKHSYTGKTDDDMIYAKEVTFINSELSLLDKTASENIIQKFKTISQTLREEFKEIYDSYQGYFDQVQNLRESIILHGYDPCKEKIREVQNAVKVTKTAKVTNDAKTKPGWRG